MEVAGEGVVVLGRDGVEFVVVTAGTGDGQPQEGLTEDIQLVVHVVRLVGQNVGRGVCRLVEVPKTGAHHGFIERLVRVSARIR